MSLLGLIKKFPVDRALTHRDRGRSLDPHRKLDKSPLAQLSVININSSHVNLVDKFYIEKGFVTFCSVLILSLAIVAVVAVALQGEALKASVYKGKEHVPLLELGFVAMIALATSVVPVFCIRQEAFRYTHYPIRLNRLNRMVYVHRIDGTILRIPWDEAYFTLVQEPMFPSGMGANWAIHGHVLDADGETVRETFAFSVVEIPEIVIGHWEFLRRYMEEGPQAVEKYIEYYVQVSTREKREPFRHSMRFSLWRYGGFSLALLPLLPIDFLVACARWVAMRTGKIPVWPEDVEAACAVADDDPWVRDARNNPARYR